jgi:hypothetical protein
MPVTDRSPPVDNAGGLVHVVTGADSLARAEDLPGTVRSKAQRAERLARPGRDPRHPVGVQRPGRLECHVAHSYLPWSALRRCYGRNGLPSRANLPLAFWANGCPGGTRRVPGRLYLGGCSPLCTGAGPDGSLGEGVADVACFCGCLYSFDGGAGACPGCGEVAAVMAGPVAAGTQRGQQGQPGPAANGHRRGGQAATWQEWAEAGPGSLAGVASRIPAAHSQAAS